MFFYIDIEKHISWVWTEPSSLKCQPCMGREVNTWFKYLPNTRTNTNTCHVWKKILNPRIPGLVLYRYSKVDTRMTHVHSPSPMWKRTHKFNLFSFQIACFFPGFCEAFGLFISFVAFTISIPNLSASSDGHHFLSMCTVKKYNVYCKERQCVL